MKLMIVSVIVMGVFAALALLMRRARGEYASTKKSLAKINAMSQDKAKKEALSTLAVGGGFRCVKAKDPGVSVLNEIPSAIAGFFEMFDSVETQKGADIRVSRELFSESEVNGLFVIGEGMVGSDTEFRLVVSPSRDEVYELHAGEPIDPGIGTFKSIWHWVLATDRDARASI